VCGSWIRLLGTAEGTTVGATRDTKGNTKGTERARGLENENLAKVGG
jgi:hypothetical protein